MDPTFDPLDEARRQWERHDLAEPEAMVAATSIIRVQQLVSAAVERTLRPLQHTVDVGGVLAGQGAQLALPGEAGLQRAGVGGQPLQVAAELVGDITDQQQRFVQPGAQGAQGGVVGRLQRGLGLADLVERRGGVDRRVVVERAGQPGAGGTGRLPQRVEFGQPADVLGERVVLPGLGCHRVDLVEREGQPVGLLGQFTGAFPAVRQIASGVQPLLMQQLVALQPTAEVGEPVQRGALFVRSHQPQLIVLAVHGEQFTGEVAQRLRRDAAAAEVGP